MEEEGKYELFDSNEKEKDIFDDEVLSRGIILKEEGEGGSIYKSLRERVSTRILDAIGIDGLTAEDVDDKYDIMEKFRLISNGKNFDKYEIQYNIEKDSIPVASIAVTVNYVK